MESHVLPGGGGCPAPSYPAGLGAETAGAPERQSRSHRQPRSFLRFLLFPPAPTSVAAGNNWESAGKGKGLIVDLFICF